MTSSEAQVELVDLDAEALRAPPGFEAFLRRPEVPQVFHRGLVAALEGDRRPCGRGGALGHFFFSL
jgi:hypothetical protein